MLGQATGRTGKAMVDWLNARGEDWRSQVRAVAIDPAARYRTAIRQALPHATIIVDHFHPVALANKALTGVRQRIPREHHGRRGRATDPEWVNRRRLPRGRERLSKRTFTRRWNDLIERRSFARLRTQNGRHLFTVKRPVDNSMACLEYETTVTDREQMHHAGTLMGFHPTVRIVKSRRTARLGDMTICVDEVEHAGAFVEIERTVSGEESGTAVQIELDAFARSLGVDLIRTTDTYDSLVRAALSPA